jgi:hypothetical protein
MAHTIVHSNERPKILFSPFFLAPATTYPRALTLAQQAKANAARAEAEAARPDVSFIYIEPRLALPPIPHLILSVLVAPLGGAAVAGGQDTANALDVYGSSCGFDHVGSSCGFDRVRSRPAKIIKSTKKAAYYPKTLCSQQSLARRLASPFFLPAASSYHEVLTVAQLGKADAACAEADAARPDERFRHAAPRLLAAPTTSYTRPGRESPERVSLEGALLPK